jgi:hypothetical protein
MGAFNITRAEIREGCGCRGRCQCFVGSELPQAQVGAAAKIENDRLAGRVFLGDMKLENALVPGFRHAKILHAHHNHVQRVENAGVWAGACAWTCAGASAKRASAAFAVLAGRARTAIEATTVTAKSAAVTTKAAAISAVAAEAATALRCRGRPFKLEFRCHGLATVLGNLEGHALAFAE